MNFLTPRRMPSCSCVNSMCSSFQPSVPPTFFPSRGFPSPLWGVGGAPTRMFCHPPTLSLPTRGRERCGSHLLHPRDTEGVGLQLAQLGLAADGEAQREHTAAVARVDEAVVPQARGGEQRGRFLLHAAGDGSLHGVELP